MEFALILPLFLMLIWGVIEAGRLLFIYTTTTSASREAARYGSSVEEVSPSVPRYVDCAGIREAAQRVGNLAGIQSSDITIGYDGGYTGSAPNPAAPTPTPFTDCASADDSDIYLGDRIVVEVNANYQPLVPFVNIPAFQIKSITARSIYKDVLIATGAPPPTSTWCARFAT